MNMYTCSARFNLPATSYYEQDADNLELMFEDVKNEWMSNWYDVEPRDVRFRPEIHDSTPINEDTYLFDVTVYVDFLGMRVDGQYLDVDDINGAHDEFKRLVIQWIQDNGHDEYENLEVVVETDDGDSVYSIDKPRNYFARFGASKSKRTASKAKARSPARKPAKTHARKPPVSRSIPHAKDYVNVPKIWNHPLTIPGGQIVFPNGEVAVAESYIELLDGQVDGEVSFWTDVIDENDDRYLVSFVFPIEYYMSTPNDKLDWNGHISDTLYDGPASESVRGRSRAPAKKPKAQTKKAQTKKPASKSTKASKPKATAPRKPQAKRPAPRRR